jgi:hypothetical protein
MSASRIPSPLAALKREVEIWAGLLFFGAGIAMLVIAANLALPELRYAREAITVPLFAAVIYALARVFRGLVRA